MTRQFCNFRIRAIIQLLEQGLEAADIVDMGYSADIVAEALIYFNTKYQETDDDFTRPDCSDSED
jgi:hypothetical protein